MIICPNCKAKLGDGSAVCVVCGTPIAAGSEQPASTPEQATAATASAVAAEPGSAPAQEKKDIGEMVKEEHEAQKSTPAPPPHAQAKPVQPPQAQAKPAQPQQQAQPAQQNIPPQAAPPPDIQTNQQQHYYPPQQNWQTHLYYQGQPNQCPRCQQYNIVYYYHDGTAYCTKCYYRYYWRTPANALDSIGRGFDRLLD